MAASVSSEQPDEFQDDLSPQTVSSEQKEAHAAERLEKRKTKAHKAVAGKSKERRVTEGDLKWNRRTERTVDCGPEVDEAYQQTKFNAYKQKLEEFVKPKNKRGTLDENEAESKEDTCSMVEDVDIEQVEDELNKAEITLEDTIAPQLRESCQNTCNVSTARAKFYHAMRERVFTPTVAHEDLGMLVHHQERLRHDDIRARRGNNPSYRNEAFSSPTDDTDYVEVQNGNVNPYETSTNRFNIKAKPLPGEPEGLICGKMFRVRWIPGEQEDTEYGLGKWDFIVLHPFGTHCSEYIASEWMRGETFGRVEICAPLEPGRYHVSVVRDLEQVMEALPSDDKKRKKISAYIKKHRVKRSLVHSVEDAYGEHLVSMGCDTICVTRKGEWLTPPSDEEMAELDAEVFTDRVKKEVYDDRVKTEAQMKRCLNKIYTKPEPSEKHDGAVDEKALRERMKELTTDSAFAALIAASEGNMQPRRSRRPTREDVDETVIVKEASSVEIRQAKIQSRIVMREISSPSPPAVL